MMTFKELKKLVKLPLYKEQRVPTVKALEESGVSVVAEKILENHGSISVLLFIIVQIDCPAEISADRKSTNRQHYECQCRN